MSKFINDINPATGEIIALIKSSNKKDVFNAVKKARKAADVWSKISVKERSSLLKKIGKEVTKNKEYIGKLITDEMGKPYKSAIGETTTVEYGIIENIKLAKDALKTEIYRENSLITELHRKPVGICAVITPWNFPVNMPESLLSPALLAGNTVVFKPSELVPLTGRALYDIFAKHLPEGVINLLQGAGDVGELLINSDVDMIAFVGSQAVGKHIMETAGKRLKRIVLELGGKDPMIVLDDADIDKAASYAVNGSLRNSGQVCVSVERIYVQKKIADKFIKLVEDGVKKFSYGSGYEDVNMGPMVSEKQRDKVFEHIKDSLKKGGKLLTGGNIDDTNKGYFIQPALITNVNHKHKIMTEETFGPVVCIQTVNDEAEAVKLANNSPYGLGATVWTKNKDRGKKIARQIESGMIGINQGLASASGTPWVGIKQSGYGYIGSVDGIRQFTYPVKISYKK